MLNWTGLAISSILGLLVGVWGFVCGFLFLEMFITALH